MKFKNIAFTLAETLVVMGIIGIIASITIPNLSQSTQNREYVAKLKKTYSELNEAFERAQAVYGPFDEWPFERSANAMSIMLCQRMSEFMKVQEVCTTSGNFPGHVRLANGFYIHTHAYPKDNGDNGLLFRVYAHNKSEKNITGKNDFQFGGGNPGNRCVSPNYTSFNTFVSKLKICQDLANDNNGSCQYYASAWILTYDNMEYLKLDPAGSNGKCLNGNTMTEANPRCN